MSFNYSKFHLSSFDILLHFDSVEIGTFLVFFRACTSLQLPFDASGTHHG